MRHPGSVQGHRNYLAEMPSVTTSKSGALQMLPLTVSGQPLEISLERLGQPMSLYIPLSKGTHGRRVRNRKPVPRRLGPRRDAGAGGSPDTPCAGDNGPRDGDGTRMIPPKAAGALASTLASTLTSKPIRSLLNGSTRQNGGGPGAGSAPTRLLN